MKGLLFMEEQNTEMQYEKALNSSRMFSAAAMILSIISLLTCMFIFISVPLAAAAIIFALLSRGCVKRSRQARSATQFAIAAMIISVCITGYSFYVVLTRPYYRKQFEQILRYYMNQYEAITEDISDPYGTYYGGSQENEPVPSDGYVSEMPEGGDYI